MTDAKRNPPDLSQYAIDEPESYERTLLDAVKQALHKNRYIETGDESNYLYLAEYLHEIDPSHLEYDMQFIIKVGQSANVRRRFSDPHLKKDFRLIAQVEVPSSSHARALEKAILDSIYRPVGRKLQECLNLKYPTDCMLVDMQEYNLIVDMLNHVFDDRPFPRR